MDHVADALDVEDDEVVAVRIHHAFKFADQLSLRSSRGCEAEPGIVQREWRLVLRTIPDRLLRPG
jgi:hypothetical protein